jgi:hypothetical protein
MLKAAGFEFYCCPGTSAWSSFTGRTDNMIANIKKTAVNGKAYGAKGLLLADWGDGGHQNYVGVSYAAYCYGAALAWNTDGVTETELETFLSQHIFRDKNNLMGRIVLDAGRYNRLEDFPMFNMTISVMTLMAGLIPKAYFHGMLDKLTSGLETMADPDILKQLQTVIANRGAFNYKGLMGYIHELQEALAKTSMDRTDADIIQDEFNNGLRMAELGVRARWFIETEDTATEEEREAMRAEIQALSTHVQAEHRRLWAVRNKPGGMERSLALFKRVEG